MLWVWSYAGPCYLERHHTSPILDPSNNGVFIHLSELILPDEDKSLDSSQQHVCELQDSGLECCQLLLWLTTNYLPAHRYLSLSHNSPQCISTTDQTHWLGTGHCAVRHLALIQRRGERRQQDLVWGNEIFSTLYLFYKHCDVFFKEIL